MPSNFNPGSGGNLVATNLPAAFQQMALLVHNSERAVAAEQRPNNLTMSADFEAGTLTVSASLPFSTNLDNTGKVVITAVDYLGALSANGGDGSFNNGNGELESTHKTAALLELAQKVQAAELVKPVDARPNNLTITFDLEAATAAVDATLPITVTSNPSGAIVVTANDYL